MKQKNRKKEIIKERRTSDQISNRGGTISSFVETPKGSKTLPYRTFQRDKSPSKIEWPHRCFPLYSKSSNNLKDIVHCRLNRSPRRRRVYLVMRLIL